MSQAYGYLNSLYNQVVFSYNIWGAGGQDDVADVREMPNGR
jgi:hypothetical protein